MIKEENEKNYRRADDVEKWNEWVSESFVGALGIRSPPAQDKYTRDRENIEDESRRNYVIEQIAVKIAVCSISFHGTRQNENASPDSLNDQSPRGDMVLIQPGNAAEKQTVARHRIICARAGEDQSVVAAEC